VPAWTETKLQFANTRNAEVVIVQARKTDFRTHAAEYLLFFFVSLFVCSEVAIVIFLIFGKRPTLRGYLLVIGCFSICWSLRYLPFRSIWEKIRNEECAINANGCSSIEDSGASMEASELANGSQTESENARALPSC
jgi:hypothetical protein